MIGYGVYHYKSERSAQEGDWPRVAFSPRKANLTIYVVSWFCKVRGRCLKNSASTRSARDVCMSIELSDIDIPTLRAIVKETLNEMNRRYPTK